MSLPSDISVSDSETSVVSKGWAFIAPNTAILAYMVCAVVTLLTELAGYWPTMGVEDLFSDTESSGANETEYPEVARVIYTFSECVDTARFYTTHVYLAAYLLLPYPLITERMKVLLTPWLICGVLRSVVLSLLSILAGISMCTIQPTLKTRCLHFSVLRGIEFCTSLFVWTSVHNFYHFLDKWHAAQGIGKMMETLQKGPAMESIRSSILLSLNSEILEDEDGTERKLVERAAMAWIAREILENEDDYVTEDQFSEYLTEKAGLELRQLLKEITKKKRESERSQKPRTTKDRIEESLDFYKTVSNHENEDDDVYFDQRRRSYRRDPIRKIPRLTVDSTSRIPIREISTKSVLTPVGYTPRSFKFQSPPTERHVHTQTDPLSADLILLFDNLEQQYWRRSSV